MTNFLKVIRPAGNIITISSSDIQWEPASFNYSYYNSGTESLAAAIIASIKLKSNIKNPEVIIPGYACPDLISAIIYAKAIPVIIDLKENSHLMSLEHLSNAITKNTVAIIAVRFFGLAERSKELSIIAKRHNIILIEDSAQGFPVGNLDSYWDADVIILSFGRGKPINLLGGGAVLCREPEFIKNLPIPLPPSNSALNSIKYKLKLRLYNQSIHPLAYGLISQIPGLKIGQTTYKPLVELKSISNDTLHLIKSNIEAYIKRKGCQKKYQQLLKNCNNEQLIDLPSKLKHDMSQPLLRYPILVNDILMRDRLYEKLKPYGASLMYKQPLYEINKVGPLIKKLDYKYQNATLFSKKLITLATHEGISRKVFSKIERILNEY